jgi:hypothetical protein
MSNSKTDGDDPMTTSQIVAAVFIAQLMFVFWFMTTETWHRLTAHYDDRFTNWLYGTLGDRGVAVLVVLVAAGLLALGLKGVIW